MTVEIKSMAKYTYIHTYIHKTITLTEFYRFVR